MVSPLSGREDFQKSLGTKNMSPILMINNNYCLYWPDTYGVLMSMNLADPASVGRNMVSPLWESIYCSCFQKGPSFMFICQTLLGCHIEQLSPSIS